MPSIRIRLTRRARPTVISDIQSVCAECSAQIAPDAKFCTRCRAPIVRRYCPGCSQLVPENTEFCPYCGVSAKTQPREAGNKPFVIAMGAVALGLAALLIRHYNAPPVEQPDRVHATKAQPAAVQPAVLKQSQKPTHARVSNAKSPSEQQGIRLNLRGHQLIKQGKMNQAVPVLRNALRLFPEDTASVSYKYALYNLGHALRRTGKPKEAVTYLEKALSMDGAWEKAASELAVAKAEAATAHPLVSERRRPDQAQ